MRRKIPLVTGGVYHIFSKSIAGFKVFNGEEDFLRMLYGLIFFRNARFGQGLSWLVRNDPERIAGNDFVGYGPIRVQLIAYCLMRTHFHLLLRQQEDEGISVFMSHLLNSYARYFNLKYKRKGHLWSAAFQNVPVETDEQALHLTRYIHLNPVTAHLVDKPEDWPFSSYSEYTRDPDQDKDVCDREHFPILSPSQYAKFVLDRVEYQRALASHKHLFLEDPAIS